MPPLQVAARCNLTTSHPLAPPLPSQLQNIATLWPVSNHTALLVCEQLAQSHYIKEERLVYSLNYNLFVTSQTPQLFHCHATEVAIMHLYSTCTMFKLLVTVHSIFSTTITAARRT